MPDVKIPKYPEALTVKSWNKAKGVLARIRKIETGITLELEKAYKQYQEAPWAKVDLSSALMEEERKGRVSAAKMKEMFRDYLTSYQPQFKSLEACFSELSTFLANKAKTLAEDEATARFAEVVNVMPAEANKFTYAVAWGTVSSENQKWFGERLKSRQEREEVFVRAREGVSKMIEKAQTDLAKMAHGTPTPKDYKIFWKDQLRGIGAQIALVGKEDEEYIKKFALPMSIAKKQWADANIVKVETKEQIAEALKKDKKLLEGFASCL
jgi:hypothetical protein